MAKMLKEKCARVPRFFWGGVCVGCRIRMAWTRAKRAVLFRRGWAEKRMMGWRKTVVQLIVSVGLLLVVDIRCIGCWYEGIPRQVAR